MPVYKGSTEVTSGNLLKGSTNIENGYKQTSQFYVNTNAITINFVDAITGASMNTTQFSSVGAPGSSFTPFTRLITVDAGRIWASGSTVTVAKSGDTGNNVTAYIVGGGSTSATLHVNGTHPSSGVTVTLTVNGQTQQALPDLNVTANTSNAVFSTSDNVALGTFSYSASQSSSGGGSCSGGTTGSGTLSSNNSSYTWYSFSAGYASGGSYGNGCGVTCTSTISASKTGYNSGSGSISRTGSNPGFTNNYTWSPSSNPAGATTSGGQCFGTCPTCNSCSGTCTASLVAYLTKTTGGPAWGSVGSPTNSYNAGSVSNVSNGDTLTTAVGASTTNFPQGAGASLGGSPTLGGGNTFITGGTMTQNITYPATNYIGMQYSGTATGANGATLNCGGTAGNGYANSQTFNWLCSGSSAVTTPVSVTITTSSSNLVSGGNTFNSATTTVN